MEGEMEGTRPNKNRLMLLGFFAKARRASQELHGIAWLAQGSSRKAIRALYMWS